MMGSERPRMFDSEQNLKRLLLHAFHNVPYYARVFKDTGITDGRAIDMSKFGKIPILTKDIIRGNFDELISRDHNSRGWYFNKTGGSTGEPLKFIQDAQFKEYAERRERYYFKEMLKIDPDRTRKIILWGSEKDILRQRNTLKQRMSNWIKKTVFLNSFRMSEDDMERYVGRINAYKPAYMRGYASSLFQLSRYINEKGRKVYSPQIIVSAAETLRDDMRRSIEMAFRAKVYDFYGSRDVGGIAGECAEGLKHIFSFWNHVEILNDGKPAGEGESGSVIVTNLFNYSMPFIRYDIGDKAVVGPAKCLCGNKLPTLKKVTGRVTDDFIKEDGTVVPAEFFIHFIGVVCNDGAIKKFQVIQESYKKIRISVVLKNTGDKLFTRDIEEKIRLAMGGDCEILWDVVGDIGKTSQGKYIYTRSLVKSGGY